MLCDSIFSYNPIIRKDNLWLIFPKHHLKSSPNPRLASRGNLPFYKRGKNSCLKSGHYSAATQEASYTVTVLTMRLCVQS